MTDVSDSVVPFPQEAPAAAAAAAKEPACKNVRRETGPGQDGRFMAVIVGVGMKAGNAAKARSFPMDKSLLIVSSIDSSFVKPKFGSKCCLLQSFDDVFGSLGTDAWGQFDFVFSIRFPKWHRSRVTEAVRCERKRLQGLTPISHQETCSDRSRLERVVIKYSCVLDSHSGNYSQGLTAGQEQASAFFNPRKKFSESRSFWEGEAPAEL